MVPKGFVYEVKVQVLFDLEDIAILMELSERHYDGRCKAAGQHGGFLYGMANHVRMTNEVPSLLTWSEVDTLCKILEGAETDPQAELAWEMRGLLLDMKKEQRDING